jgi:hypothetical protein
MIRNEPSLPSCGTDRTPGACGRVDMRRANRQGGPTITKPRAAFATRHSAPIGDGTPRSRGCLLLPGLPRTSALQLPPASLALLLGADGSHAGDEHRARDASDQSADLADPGARLPRGNGYHVQACTEAGEPVLRATSTGRATARLGHAPLIPEATRTLPSSCNSSRI